MIRVRFAPSPTGSLHVGGARTALFNWLYVQNARRKGEDATFILRVEDTDKERSTPAFTQVILDGMAWLGMTPDEGPFFTSDGLARHQADADRLVAEGKAYLDEGAVRFKVTHEDITWNDAVHGPISFQGKDLEDFIILRADRTPVYNFAVVSDDVDQRITHVIRANDHISNTPRQILIYRALGHELPVFGHVPMVNGMDGKKLSKRHGATAVGDYQERFLPEAMINFLALIGWSPGGDRELFFDVNELIDAFSMDGLQGKAAVFDEKKLEWMNAEHLKHMGAAGVLGRLHDPELAALPNAEALVGAVLARSKTIADVRVHARSRAGLDPITRDEKAEAFVAKDPDGYRKGLALAAEGLRGAADWSAAGLEAFLRTLAESNGMKAGQVMQPIRIALTGSTVSEPVNELLHVIGKDAALDRLRG
jgi:glutamyl-tRNA synthetase